MTSNLVQQVTELLHIRGDTMLLNYLLVAWRHLLKNKLYASINVIGLTAGLTVYLFGFMLAEYEKSHDRFFSRWERIYTISSIFSPTAAIGLYSLDSVHTAVGPIVRSEVPEIEAVARTYKQEFLVSIDDADFYQTIMFADADLLRIFDFSYVEGDASALTIPNALVLTRSTARRYFGDGSVIGRSISLDHDKELTVRAVVEDLPLNSHFNSSPVQPTRFEAVAPLGVLSTETRDFEQGDWNSLALGDLTYLLLPPEMDLDELQAKLDGIHERHWPKESDLISGFELHRLDEANTFLWRAVGIPVIDTVQLLALLVLIIAIVNYSNLATAQSFGRTREVGMRKTMGARRFELLLQFLIESVFYASIAMLLSIFILELIIPAFNAVLGKALLLDYVEMLTWLLATTLIVGTLGGIYPAYIIINTNPIDALRGTSIRGVKGNRFRSLMIGVQFAISIFMLALVIVVYLQNAKIEASGDIYPRSETVVLERLGLREIRDRLDVLQNEVRNVRGVVGIEYSSQVPFEQSNTTWKVSAEMGDELAQVEPNLVEMSSGFLQLYDIPLLKGRYLSDKVTGDTLREGADSINVIVNELLLTRLGYTLDSEDPVFYDFPDDRAPRAHAIVGVVPDQNFLGFHNQIKPMFFQINPNHMREASIRIEGRGMQETIQEVEAIWDDLIPEYPIQVRFLDEIFHDVFKIYSAVTGTLVGFAFIAVILSMVGLFGLCAFMVEQRTREIGIRKVLGASVGRIAALLIWQFSRPVMVALVVALPAAQLATTTYLTFFPDRIAFPLLVIGIAGICGLALAWLVISFHAVRIGRTSPIHALRYE